MWYNKHMNDRKGCSFVMSKGRANKKYTGEFKQKVVETMQKEKLGYSEAARRFGVANHSMVANWERIYLEEGPEGLYVERRGKANSATGTRKGRPPKLDKKVEEDLIAEVQRLRAENDYLKKLKALVMEEERQNKRRK
jgi:transposase